MTGEPRDGGGGAATGIKVIIRVRPLLPRELMDDEVVNADETSSVVTVENDRGTMATSFDRVFGPRTTQVDLYQYAEPDIRQVLGGYNTTVFAYGQTGTGKTYTMLGGDYTGKQYKKISLDPEIRDGGWADGDRDQTGGGTFDLSSAFGEGGHGGDGSSTTSRAGTPSTSGPRARQQLAARGMIPRAAETLFEEIHSRYGDVGSKTCSCVVTCTYLEIYNEHLHDLLEGTGAAANWKKGSKAAKKTKGHQPDPFDIRAQQRRQTLEIKEDPSGSGAVYCPDLTSVKVTSASAVMALVRKGNRNRTVRQTEMNEHSSRSHTILQLRVEQRTSGGGPDGRGALITAKLNLVDLAGSERWRDPEAMEGDRLNEMTSINTSLSALASVIAALTDRNRKHIPYRDSKLTHLLADSLGGNCRTTVVATVSPAAEAFEETCSTLKFADRTRSVTTYLQPNMKADDTMMVDRLQKEVRRLRGLLVEYANAAGEGGAVLGGGAGLEGGGNGKTREDGAAGGLGGVLATMQERLEASEVETQRLRERNRALEETLKAEREQRRHLARGWEEEKRGILLQHKEALAAAEARAGAGVAAFGMGGASSMRAVGRVSGGSGGVGAVAAARAMRADTGSGDSFSIEHFGTSVSYAHKAPGAIPSESPYAAGLARVDRGSTSAARAPLRVSASADGKPRGKDELVTSHSRASLLGAEGAQVPDEAWGGSDAGEGEGGGPPKRAGAGWGRSSILGANWQPAPQPSPEPPEPSMPSVSKGYRADSPKKAKAKKAKKPAKVADDLGSWMYILGSTRSSLEARNMANTGLLQQMHARMDAADERRRNAEKDVAEAVGGYAHLKTKPKMVSDGGGGTAAMGEALISGGYSAAAGQTWGRSALLGKEGSLGKVEGDLTVEETSPVPATRKTWGRSSLMATGASVAASPAPMAVLSEAPLSASTSDSGRASVDENQAPPSAGVSTKDTAGGAAVARTSPVPPQTPPPPKAWGRSALLAEKVNGTTPTVAATGL